MARYLLLIPLLCATAFAEDAVRVSVCDLKSDPARYNHKLVEVTGQVSLEFEGQGIEDSNCNVSAYSVWITFGGDVSDPAVYCCASHDRQPGEKATVEGFEIPIEKDALFKRLILDAKAYRMVPGAKTEDDRLPGPFYSVAATVIGRFFSGNQQKEPRFPYPGYGHMGCCTLLVIQKVVSIDQEVSNARPGDLKCLNDSWSAPEDQASTARRQASIVAAGETWRVTDPERVATESLVEIRRWWDDDAVGSLTGKCKQKRFKNPDTHLLTVTADCEWKSADGRTTYVISLEKDGALTQQYKSPEHLAWLPTWAHRATCTQP